MTENDSTEGRLPPSGALPSEPPPLDYQSPGTSPAKDIWTTPPLTPVAYRPWQEPEPSGGSFGGFFMGVLAGNAAILLGFLLAAASFSRAGTAYPIFIAIGGEAVLGLVLVITSRSWRAFGIGLIAAAPIGAMLFFVGCFLILAANR